MKKLNETTNVNILSQFDLGTGYQAVVQKGNVGSKYVYALQLRGGVTTILRGYRGGNINQSILELSGQAGGHTQTWEFAGNHNDINGNTRAGQHIPQGDAADVAHGKRSHRRRHHLVGRRSVSRQS